MRSKTTLAIITFNEEKNIGRALRSVLRGSVLPEEILIVDNGSQDRTQLIVEALSMANPVASFRWISTSKNNLGYARSLAVQEAKGAWIAFLDADCEVPPDWLNRLEEAFSFYRSRYVDVAGIGGEAFPPGGENSFYDAMRGMRKSFLGHLNSPQAKPIDRDQIVEHLPTTNCILERSLVLGSGNFSEAFDCVCEDVELSLRMRKRGLKFFFVRGVGIAHFSDDSWEGWVERIYRFGWGQFKVASIHPQHFGLRLALPFVFLLTFAGALLFSFWFPVLLILPLSYFVVLLFISLLTLGRAFPKLLSLFIVTHFAYAIGELIGFIRFMLPRIKIPRLLRVIRG
jgi:GT2 family glycosyltransferase